MDTDYRIRKKAVRCYIASGSLEKCAKLHNVHPLTVGRWVQWYRQGGEQNLKRKKPYRKSWNRIISSIEQQVVSLKESKPCLTLSEARDILRKNQITISIHGIWNIWKRYYLAGAHGYDDQPDKDIATPETRDGLEKAEHALDSGEVRKAARILNALPSCADNEILKKIPDSFLSLQRKIDKLSLTYGEIPFQETRRKANTLRKMAEERNFLFLSIRAGNIELRAIGWLGTPEKQIDLTRMLMKRIMRRKGERDNNSAFRFNLLVSNGITFGYLGKVKETLSCIRECSKICRNSSISSCYRDIASLYALVGSYKKSHQWLLKSFEYANEEDKTILNVLLAGSLAKSGKYREAKAILNRMSVKKRGLTTLTVIVSAQCLIGKGEIQKAAKLANIALEQSKTETIHTYLAASSIILSCCLCALGEREKAKKLLTRMLPVLKRFRMEYELLLPRIVLGHSALPKDVILSPSLKLAVLLNKASRFLKTGDYRRALDYAASQHLIGYFHRLVFFFPESVNRLIAKGKHTGLPLAILKQPVFQKNIPVYYIEFLGSVHVYRNGVRLRDDPTPSYASFNIHLGFKKRIELNSLYRNFWPHAKNPRGSLSHLLFGLRKYLRLPPNTLFIKQGFLHFKGFITSDYQEFEQTLVQARALERVGEWSFAKREYLRAFALFRGEPFKKMYDPWSEHIRRVILNKLETEALHFAKSCLERRNKKDAQKVLKRVSKIIPGSEEIKKMVWGSRCSTSYGINNGVPEKR